jgi:hypothetical protein
MGRTRKEKLRRSTVLGLSPEIEFPAFYLKTVPLSDIFLSFLFLSLSSWQAHGQDRERKTKF